MDIPSLTIDSIREGLHARQFSAAELTAEILRFAETENPKTNAYLHFSPERALANAKRVDEQLARGEDPGPLAGVPVAVKDVIVTKGVRTTCASKFWSTMFRHTIHGCHSFGTTGGILIGKTNCDEFAMGSSNENSAFGQVRNPVAPDRVPGGSSGGSAAVVAQGTAMHSSAPTPVDPSAIRRPSVAWWEPCRRMGAFRVMGSRPSPVRSITSAPSHAR